jgi:hypothetical protein
MDAQKIFEVEGSVDDSTLAEVYKERFTTPQPQAFEEKIERYIAEIFNELPQDSSLLLFGSGHSDFANAVEGRCKNISEIACVDRIREASYGLKENITFYNMDILKEDLPMGYDYIFSSHTLEHFTRKELIDIVIPKMKKCALEAVIGVVPHGDRWEGEPSHRCRFYIGDELFCSSKKYKFIHKNNEMVVWI